MVTHVCERRIWLSNRQQHFDVIIVEQCHSSEKALKKAYYSLTYIAILLLHSIWIKPKQYWWHLCRLTVLKSGNIKVMFPKIISGCKLYGFDNFFCKQKKTNSDLRNNLYGEVINMSWIFSYFSATLWRHTMNLEDTNYVERSRKVRMQSKSEFGINPTIYPI